MIGMVPGVDSLTGEIRLKDTKIHHYLQNCLIQHCRYSVKGSSTVEGQSGHS